MTAASAAQATINPATTTGSDSRQHHACLHCGANSVAAAAVTTADGLFCCHGCAGAWQLVTGAGLGAYYQLREGAAMRPSGESWQAWDEPAVQQRVCRDQAGGVRAVDLHFAAIQCAACVWLLEQVLMAIPGVLDVDLSLEGCRGTLTFDPDELALSDLLARCDALGYPGVPLPRGQLLQDRAVGQSLLVALGIAGLAMMQVMALSAAGYLDLAQDMAGSQSALLRWGALLVGSLVLVTSSKVFILSALAALRHRRLNMDVPVALAMIAAWVAGTVAVLRGSGHLWFDSLVMFTFLLLAGRVLEHRLRAARQASTFDLAGTARRCADDGTLATVPVWLLEVGDRVQLQPGDLVPTDVRLVSGSLELDTASLTGETLPVLLQSGTQAASGSRVLGGQAVAQVIAAETDSTAARLRDLLARAQQPEGIVLADRVAAVFVPVVLALAACTTLGWLLVDPGMALSAGLAVLVITCPCALSLAGPAATSATLLRLRRAGVAVADAGLLERLPGIRAVVLDKTGTLTLSGQLRAAGSANLDADTALALAAAMEAGSQHPLARMLRRQAEHLPAAVQSASAARVTAVRLHQRQVTADIKGIGPVRLGSAPAAANKQADADDSLQLCDGQGQVLASFIWQDRLRADARAMVSGLLQRGLDVHLLSGDSPSRVAAAAAGCGLRQVQSQATAEDKLDAIRNLQAAAGPVLFVGDGDNDAAGLATADVAVTLAEGTNLANTRAGAVLTGNRLLAVLALFEAAKDHQRTLRQNLAWALLYNLLAVPAAVLGLVAPWAAAAGMAVSSVLVSVNAARLVRRPLQAAGDLAPDQLPPGPALAGTL